MTTRYKDSKPVLPRRDTKMGDELSRLPKEEGYNVQSRDDGFVEVPVDKAGIPLGLYLDAEDKLMRQKPPLPKKKKKK